MNTAHRNYIFLAFDVAFTLVVISILNAANLAVLKLHDVLSKSACLIAENVPYLAKLFIKGSLQYPAFLQATVFFSNNHVCIVYHMVCLYSLNHLNRHQQRYRYEGAIQAKCREHLLHKVIDVESLKHCFRLQVDLNFASVFGLP